MHGRIKPARRRISGLVQGRLYMVSTADRQGCNSAYRAYGCVWTDEGADVALGAVVADPGGNTRGDGAPLNSGGAGGHEGAGGKHTAPGRAGWRLGLGVSYCLCLCLSGEDTVCGGQEAEGRGGMVHGAGCALPTPAGI